MTNPSSVGKLHARLRSEADSIEVNLAGPETAVARGQRRQRRRRGGVLGGMATVVAVLAVVTTWPQGSEDSITTQPVVVAPLGSTDEVSPIRAERQLADGLQRNQLVVDCMRSRGWAQQDPPPVPTTDTFTVAQWQVYAQDAGFGRTTLYVHPAANELTAVMTANSNVGLSGDEATRDRYLADSEACAGEVDAERGANGPYLEQLRTALDRVAAAPEVQTAERHWSDCMAERGIDAPTPQDLEQRYVDLMVQGNWPPTTPQEEISAATLTVECARVHLWPVTRAVELRELATVLAANPDRSPRMQDTGDQDPAGGPTTTQPPRPSDPTTILEDSDGPLLTGRRCEAPQPTLAIFMQVNATASEIEAVDRLLSEDAGVESYTYLDHDGAYAEFVEQFADSPELVAAVRPEDLPTSFTAVAPQSVARLLAETELAGVKLAGAMPCSERPE